MFLLPVFVWLVVACRVQKRSRLFTPRLSYNRFFVHWMRSDLGSVDSRQSRRGDRQVKEEKRQAQSRVGCLDCAQADQLFLQPASNKAGRFHSPDSWPSGRGHSKYSTNEHPEPAYVFVCLTTTDTGHFIFTRVCGKLPATFSVLEATLRSRMISRT